MNFDHWFVRAAAYVAFGLFVFVATLLLTFPDGRIKQIAAVQIESQLEKRFKQNYEVDVDDFDLWWLWGAELEGVTIRRQDIGTGAGTAGSGSAGSGGSGAGTSFKAGATKAGSDTKTADQKTNQKAESTGQSESNTEPLTFTLDSVAARLAPLSSLTNQALAVTYSVGLGNGTISGTVVRGSDALSVSAAIANVQLSKIEFIRQYTGVPMFGEISGDISLDFMPGRAVVQSGDIAIDGKQLTFGPKSGLKLEAVPIDPDIPSTNLGNLTIRMKITSDQPGRPEIVIEEFNAEGRDIQRLQAWGRIELASRMSRTKFRVTLRTKFRNEFIQKNNLGPILQIKQFRNGNRNDWYGFIVVGYLSNLTFKGASAATTGPPQNREAGAAPAAEGSGEQPRKLKRK